MPVVKQTIKSEIDALINQLTSGDPVNDNPEASKEAFADGLADIIVNAITSANATIPA